MYHLVDLRLITVQTFPSELILPHLPMTRAFMAEEC